MLNNRRETLCGFSLVEVTVAIGIVLLLFAIATPFYLRYRGQNSVNRAIEVSKAVIERGIEEAKSLGYPLPDQLLQNGIATPAATQSSPDSVLVVRLLKKTNSANPAAVITQRELPRSNSFLAHFKELGLLEEEDFEGVMVEFVERAGGAETVMASLPIDVNGQFVLLGEAGHGAIHFQFGDYARHLKLSARGVVTSDRR